MTDPTREPVECDNGEWLWVVDGWGGDDPEFVRCSLPAAVMDVIGDTRLGFLNRQVAFFATKEEAVRAYDAAVKSFKAKECQPGMAS